MNKSSTKNSCFFPHFCRGKVKVQSSFFVLITLVALSVINRAWADCQENPIGVTFSKDVVKRFKSYDCVISGTVPGDKITFEFFTFTNMSASMILSGQSPATLSAVVGKRLSSRRTLAVNSNRLLTRLESDHIWTRPLPTSTTLT
jgi:hypothetical protein